MSEGIITRRFTPTPIVFTATGGTESVITVGDVQYRVHTFTSSGNFEVVTGEANIDYLVVAGGGAGGAGSGGGGGAGGVITTFNSTPLLATPQIYPIVVGAGGSGAVSRSTYPGTATDSTAFGQTAIRGGHGAANPGDFDYNAQSGGSGGGGGRWSAGRSAASGTAGQGNAGGGAFTSQSNGGGGGGFSQVGANAPAGAGGNGFDATAYLTSAFGDSGWFAGGGGGACTGEDNGGLGGGGQGGGNGTSGTINTGGGGGGGCLHAGSISGAGGSGIVIIRYAV